MRTLYIHVGHGKTGSSYLQSLFATNAFHLEERGIRYPMDETTTVAVKGRITTGNGHLLIRELLGETRMETDSSVFYSSEFLFPYLMEEWFPLNHPFWSEERAALEPGVRWERLVSWATERGFDRVRFLLFIRDPVSHAVSLYQQRIKRGGATGTLADSMAHYEIPLRVAHFLDLTDAFAMVETTVRNYSRVASRLPRIVEDWLGLGEGGLRQLSDSRVNRTMTVSELELLRHLNHQLHRKTTVLSDALCHRIPELETEKYLPSRELQNELWERNRESIERVNARLPPDSGYRFDKGPPSADRTRYDFSMEQLKVIAECLGSEIAELGSQLEEQSAEQDLLLDEHKEKIGELKREIHELKAFKKRAKKRIQRLGSRRRCHLRGVRNRLKRLLRNC